MFKVPFPVFCKSMCCSKIFNPQEVFFDQSMSDLNSNRMRIPVCTDTPEVRVPRNIIQIEHARARTKKARFFYKLDRVGTKLTLRITKRNRSLAQKTF